ncbi:MAG: exodeoxyribonuclease VII large subunit [Planctomycetes bacterium]|nr:exodeoxyribonuclease VII large subunit [Planctomycetota bacterium]
MPRVPTETVPVLTVSALTFVLKEVVETSFPHVWVSGEISNLMRAGSGHVYFTLKDDAAQLKGVMWRSAAQRLRFDLRDGMDVIVAGAIQVYEARGQHQIVVEQMQPKGIGPLELAFRQLQQKLAAEGLFAPERKRPLPRYPRRVALVTSPTGAAVRDMIQVMTRRWPRVDIVIVPVAVQGDPAAGQIAAALRRVHLIPGVDVVICGRGGGSLEDLWAFNEEVVARAIHACRVPVISAVGHEVDVTIADLVADRRALTPSEAAELVVPLESDVRMELNLMRQRLVSSLRQQTQRARVRLDSLADRRCFTRPLDRLHDLSRRLDELEGRLNRGVRQSVATARQQLHALASSLNALSPLAVLDRGYSLTKRVADGELIDDAGTVAIGDQISTLLARGSMISEVKSIEVDDE